MKTKLWIVTGIIGLILFIFGLFDLHSTKFGYDGKMFSDGIMFLLFSGIYYKLEESKQ